MQPTKLSVRRAAKIHAARSHASNHISTVPVSSEKERDTLQLRVYQALARGLMAGMFKPGEAVTLRTLAERLGTSAMPVREAVSRLIAERALVLLPNRSVIVPRMTRERFAELSQARRMLEGMVAEAACAHVTPTLIRHMSDINELMKRSIEKNSLHDALSHNLEFHFTLYRSSGRQVVLPLIEMLWLQAGPFLALSLATPGVRWSARQHKAVLTALRASNPAAARLAIEADVEETAVQLLQKANFENIGTVVANGSRPAVPDRLAYTAPGLA
jgi:DNA-binding GntR family transcriptional regulator